MIEFTYNNSLHSTIGMALYKALYERRCRTPLCWLEPRENLTLGPEVVQQTTEKVKLIQERMRIAQSRRKNNQDKRRKDLEFEVGDHVFLRVTPWTGVGRALKFQKLTLCFIDPFQVLWHTKFHYPCLFLIFIMPFICLNFIRISMIHLM